MNSRLHIFMPCWRHIQRGVHSKAKIKLASKFDFTLNESVDKAIEAGTFKPRRHPGVQKIPPVSLPDELEKAASLVLSEYSSKSLQTDSQKLAKYITARHPMLEGLEFSDKLQQVTDSIIQKETIDPMSPSVPEEVKKRLLDSRTSKVHEKMKTVIYHWKPIDFNAYTSSLYVMSRMAPDFAALIKVLSEIKKRDVNFAPVTMLDFGSGVGTGMWALDMIWPNTCNEVVCVDASPEMNTMADRLTRRGSIDNERIVRPAGTFFKQFLPLSDVLKYNIVISSRSLFELPNMESRLRTLDVLWRKTTGYLLIIEAGTNAGYKLVLEARDYILQMSENIEETNQNVEKNKLLQAHVFSPCAHDNFCPRYFDGTYTPCNFEVSYNPPSFSNKKNIGKDKYSYVVLKKGQISTEEERPPRVVRDPMLRQNHIICQLCTKYGTLMNITATKKKHSKACYNVLKVSQCGDLLPVVLPEPENVNPSPTHSDSELESNDDEVEAKVY